MPAMERPNTRAFINASPWLVFALFGSFACSINDAADGAAAGQGGQLPLAGASSGGSAAGSNAVSGGAGGANAVGGSGVVAGSAGAVAGGAGAGGAGGAGGAANGGNAGAAGGGGQAPVCPAGPFPKPEAGNAVTVCQGFQYQHDYNEGPTWVASQGAFFFSNFVQGAAGGNVTGDIIKYTPGGNCEFFIKDVGTNGLAVSISGNLLGAAHKTRSITEWDITTLQPTILSDKYMDKLLDSPNDLVQSSTGNIYFSNPTYELGGRPQGIGGAIFRRDPQGMLTLLKQSGAPNGVAISPKEDRLYVVNGGLWDLDANGVASNNRDFPLNADGLGVDCAGNVYLSGGSIRDPNGQEIAKFSGGTNLAFGGADAKTLLVVGGGTNVKTVPMNLPGLP
jgi:gluconolactonase